MKKYLLILAICFAGLVANAQNANDKVITAKVEALNQAIFGVKDSLALENLLGKEIIYCHSGGKVENRQEMIKGALANGSVYDNLKTDITNIVFQENTAVVRHIISASEKNKAGVISPLKLGVVQTWVKEHKTWKLIGRQAVKLPLL